MNRRLALKHIQPGSSNLFACQGCGQGCVVHNAATRDVHQCGRGLHLCQFCRTNGVVRCSRVRQYQHQVVSGFQKLVFADVTGLARGLQRRIEARAVVIDDVHAKAQRPASGNTLPDAAHAQHAQRGAMDVVASKHVKAPFVPFSGAQVVLTLGDAPGCGHEQCKTKVSSGFGQHIRCIGGQHTCLRHGVQVKVVVAHRHVGADFQIRAGGQHLGINAVTACRESALPALQFGYQLCFAPDLIKLVGRNIKVLLQSGNDLRKNGTGNQNFGLGHGGFTSSR